MANKTHYRREAKRLGLDWPTVEETYRRLRQLQREEREGEWTIRRWAWQMMTPRGCWDFWRHGFHVRWPWAFGEGDRDCIPGLDVVAQELSFYFPELAIDDDPTETLYELLAKPHNKLPSADETWQQAIEMCRDGECLAVGTTDDFAFGANVDNEPF